MTFHPVHHRSLLLWRLRLCLIMLLPSFLCTFFLAGNSTWWLWGTGIWMTTFFAFFFWYYPLKYRKLSYAMEDALLVVNSGVIYTRRSSVQLPNIQYVTLLRFPLARLLGLCTVKIQLAGGQIRIPGVLHQEGLRLQTLLCPTQEDWL